MPNWCNNHVVLEHDDPEQIAKLVAAAKDGNLFNTFLPCPYDPSEGEGWYDWRLNNWGTKWDAGDQDTVLESSERSANLAFESAWSPPIAFYEHLAQNGWTVTAYYYEPGMMYCGRFTNEGGDEYYNIQSNADWVQENIPKQIDEEFGIAEEILSWAEDDA